MDSHFAHNLYDRRPAARSRAPPVKWFKEWVPQDVVATGGKCFVLKWVNEATLKAMKDKSKEPEASAEPEPEPTTEVLFLCSYAGCGKTFIDAGALRKHSHIHGERQYICHYENCGKKFLDSSKLKRHFLIHTGERDFVCPYEGCGKAFSLDFNLRSHMKTHSQENYHICPYPDCGKRYAHEYKLKNHIQSHHEKTHTPNVVVEAPPPRYTPPVEKPTRTPKVSAVSSGPSLDRPYGCPYEGCDKAYIHEYKLNLHLKREHPGHFPPEENTKNTHNNNENEMEEGSDHEAYARKRSNGKAQKQSRPKPDIKPRPAKVQRRKAPVASPANLNNVVVKKPWPVKDETYEEDSEETEEERDDMVGGEAAGWRYGDNNEEDDEETEDEE